MAALLATVTGLVPTACQESEHTSRQGSVALYVVGASHRLCTSSERVSAFTEGLDSVLNRGPAPVTVDEASWVMSEGLTLNSVRYIQLQPGDGFGGFGVWNGDPPRGLKAPGYEAFRSAWERSEPLVGAELPTTTKWHYLNIIVSYSGTEGRAGPLEIHYTDGDGERGTVKTKVRVRVEPDCSASWRRSPSGA